jgi:hypothetical protein
MTAVRALGVPLGRWSFPWGDETYLQINWLAGEDQQQLSGAILGPDVAGAISNPSVDPWGATLKITPVLGPSGSLKTYTFLTEGVTLNAAVFNTFPTSWCPLSADIGVLFTTTSATLDYLYDEDGHLSFYTGLAIYAWPISSDGHVGPALLIGNYDHDSYYEYRDLEEGSAWQPAAFVTDSATRLRVLDSSGSANDLVLDVARDAITLVSQPATFGFSYAEPTVFWGQMDAYENFGGESWYAKGNDVAKVGTNLAGARVRAVSLVDGAHTVDGHAHSMVRVGPDEIAIMTVYGVGDWSYPNGQWAVFIVKGGVVSLVPAAWASVNHQYLVTDYPLDEFTSFVVLRANVSGGGDTSWPTQDMGSVGGTYSIAAFDYPALTRQVVDWQTVFTTAAGGSSGEGVFVLLPVLQGNVLVLYCDQGQLALILIGGAAADYIDGAAHFDR